MKTSVTTKELQASVLSVPPLARRADMTIDREQNARLLDHLRSGGVRTFMYGGNANLYNMGVTEFGALLELLQSLAQDGDWMIPSVGSDFGKAMDQVAVAKKYPFPTVMVLPQRFPANPAGIAGRWSNTRSACASTSRPRGANSASTSATSSFAVSPAPTAAGAGAAAAASPA